MYQLNTYWKKQGLFISSSLLLHLVILMILILLGVGMKQHDLESLLSPVLVKFINLPGASRARGDTLYGDMKRVESIRKRGRMLAGVKKVATDDKTLSFPHKGKESLLSKENVLKEVFAQQKSAAETTERNSPEKEKVTAELTAITSPMKESHSVTKEIALAYLPQHTVESVRDNRGQSLHQPETADKPSSIDAKFTYKPDASSIIKVDIPSSNMVDTSLYRLQGEITIDVDTAYLSVNDVRQLISLTEGHFVADVSMVHGTNRLTILARGANGETYNYSFNLFCTIDRNVPVINLESPKNGLQGAKPGDPILVRGTVNDLTITRATLLLNDTNSIPISVRNGIFKWKVFLPQHTRVNTFRVMAKNNDGKKGYSPVHTIITGANEDLLNPRPF